MDKKSREILYTTLAGVQYVSSEIACGSNHSPPWKWGLGTDETWVKSLSLCGLWGLEGTRRYLSPSREVAAAIPRSREGAATHAGVDRRWHAVCDTEGIDERHTGARLHGGTRDPRRGVTETVFECITGLGKLFRDARDIGATHGRAGRISRV